MCRVSHRYWERDCKMLIRLSDKRMCVGDTGGVITEGSEVKIVPFPISSGPSIDLFCQHTTPILCLLRIHTPHVPSADWVCMLQGLSSVYSIYIHSLVCLKRETHILHTVHMKRKCSHKHIAPFCDHITSQGGL